MQNRKEHGLYPSLRQLDQSIRHINELRRFIDDPSGLTFIEKQGPPIKNGFAAEVTVGGLTVRLILTGKESCVSKINSAEFFKEMQQPLKTAAAAREVELMESLPETFARVVQEVEDQCQRYPSIAQFRSASILLSGYYNWVGADRVWEAVERCQAAWNVASKKQTSCRVPRVFPSHTTLFLRHKTPHVCQQAQ